MLTVTQKRRPVNGSVWPRRIVPWKTTRPAAFPRRIATYDGPSTALIARPGARRDGDGGLLLRGGRRRGRVRVVARGRPRADDEDRRDRDGGEDAEHDERLEAPAPALGRASRQPLGLRGDEARVVLVHVELAVEAEVVGVGAQEAADVRLGREQRELLVLERAQVLAADLRRLLGLRDLDPPAVARLAEAAPYLEHRGPVRSAAKLQETVEPQRDGAGEREVQARPGEDAAGADEARALAGHAPVDAEAGAAGGEDREEAEHERGRDGDLHRLDEADVGPAPGDRDAGRDRRDREDAEPDGETAAATA